MIDSGTQAGGGYIRVLGVDPAAAGPTGYGIVEAVGRNCRAVHYGAHSIENGRRNTPGAALYEIHTLMCQLIAEFRPDVVAVENIFTALNMKTALRLAEVRGVVLLAAAQHGLEVHSYAPREVKASVAGYGHADKKQIQLMVRALLAMTETPEPADAADALAVALCHFQAERMRHRFGLPRAVKSSSAKISVPASSVALNRGVADATPKCSRRIVPTR